MTRDVIAEARGLIEREDGPFHVSRTSDGERHWFSAYDPASGVSIPGKDRDDAAALVLAINRACAAFAHAQTAPLLAHIDAQVQRAPGIPDYTREEVLAVAHRLDMWEGTWGEAPSVEDVREAVAMLRAAVGN